MQARDNAWLAKRETGKYTLADRSFIQEVAPLCSMKPYAGDTESRYENRCSLMLNFSSAPPFPPTFLFLTTGMIERARGRLFDIPARRPLKALVSREYWLTRDRAKSFC